MGDCVVIPELKLLIHYPFILSLFKPFVILANFTSLQPTLLGLGSCKSGAMDKDQTHMSNI